MNAWEKDKRWSDRFLPQIKRILGEHLISEPPIEEDAERNTDLIVLRLEAVRIACRIRKAEYQQKYFHDITIRCGSPSGAKTELTKIIAGWGDYFFYGFANADETEIEAWRLISLEQFRIWFNRALWEGMRPGTEIPNHDGSSSFRAFDLRGMPSDVIFRQHPS
jgi:hypothetical protein